MAKSDSKAAAKAAPAEVVAPKAAAKPNIESASVPIKPTWDDSTMQSSYANVCNVLGTREEITVLFGTSQSWQASSPGPSIKLSHRIVLTPYTAKRLAQMLEQGVREYEQRFGDIKLS